MQAANGAGCAAAEERGRRKDSRQQQEAATEGGSHFCFIVLDSQARQLKHMFLSISMTGFARQADEKTHIYSCSNSFHIYCFTNQDI